MNVFYIPSWYPSANHPIYGTFVKDQIALLALHNPDWNLGVSTWGQGDPAHMLWVKEPLTNLIKICSHNGYQSYSDQSGNLIHLQQPTMTWTRKILHGNLSGVIKANEKNLETFIKQISKVDLIHAQATYPAALIAQTLAAKYAIPYVVSIRMSPFPFPEFLTKKGVLKALITEPLKNAGVLLATSHALKETLESYGFTKVRVVNNPVDTEFFKPIDVQTEAINLLTIGRMEHQKGIDLLIEAVSLLGDRFLGMLRIGGAGSLMKEYQQLAIDKGVDHRIKWLGELSREEVRNEMHRCSYYVLPSRHETFGNVLLEALACGKPVLATRCGGPTDIVTNEVGLLCETENPHDLAKKILEMQNVYLQYSPEALKAYINNNFSPQIFSKEMADLYGTLKN